MVFRDRFKAEEFLNSKDSDLCTSGREEREAAAAVCPLWLWGSGFDVGFLLVFLFSFSSPSPHSLLRSPTLTPPSSSSFLCWLYIASPCCVTLLNQWALILLLKHCGLYWGKKKQQKKKKSPWLFKAVCFLGGKVVRGGGEWGYFAFAFLFTLNKNKMYKNKKKIT